MTPHSSRVTMDFRASVSELWQALTLPEIIKKYFFDSDILTTWKPGDPLLFTGQWEGKTYTDKGIVQRYEFEKQLQYSYYSSFSPLPDLPENYMLITYTVTALPNGARLEILQENAPSKETAEHSDSNWMVVLTALKNWLERE
jgi:uncharacterized protein YndB with AHSA1/START domain